jgi:ABC-type lipoprotein release transport system permease subunit
MKLSALPARIAWRYLRAPKSHSAVSAISIVSVVGVAVATAAIICVLSVFNGFRGLLNDKLDTLAPDVLITPAKGKTFANADSIAGIVADMPSVEEVMPAVVDNALAISESREMPVTLRGVDPEAYARITSVDSIIFEGAKMKDLTPADAVVSVGTGQQLAIYATGGTLLLFAPRREGRVNLANPMSSFLTDSVSVAGIFQAMQSDYDNNTVICDITTARNLFQYTTEATQLEVKATPGTDLPALASDIELSLGPNALAKDRARQQQTNFRMVEIEKWVTFLLLIFILLIASFNIISTLCMLIIEKQHSMATLSALGMSRKSIGATFWWESMYVSMSGGIAGIITGLALCLIQEHFGLIKLGGDPEAMIITAYPVAVEWSDVLIALAPVTIIGLAAASIASAFARSRIERP